MMSNPFAPASKKQSKLRMALVGPSGSGKTFSAIKIASEFGKVAVIDTEHGSASKYAGLFKFDVLELTNFDPKSYIDALKAAADNGYDAAVIDSLSHSWKELLNQKNILDARGGNSYVNWGKITPKQDALIEAILAAPIHVIATMRAKMDHVIEKDDRGNTTVRKVGLAPIQRDDVEYEFDVVADMDINNTMMVSKSRCVELSNKSIPKPGAEVAKILKDWLTDGAPVVEAPIEFVQAVSPSDMVETPQNAVDPLLALKNANSEMVVGDVKPYQEWELKNAVLKPYYNNNTFHLEGSLKKLVESGKLHPGLTLEQAIEVVKTRKDDTPAKEATA